MCTILTYGDQGQSVLSVRIDEWLVNFSTTYSFRMTERRVFFVLPDQFCIGITSTSCIKEVVTDRLFI